MTILNGQTAVQVNEFYLLNMIVDKPVQRLERLVMNFFNVQKFEALPQKARFSIYYLNIVMLNNTRATICELYNLTEANLVSVTTKVHYELMNNADDERYFKTIHDLYMGNIILPSKIQNCA